MFNLNTETAMKIFGHGVCQNCACNHPAAGEQPEACTVIGSWGFPKAQSNVLFSHQTQLVGKYSLLWEMYPSEQRHSCDRDRTGNYCKYYTESHHLKQCKTNRAIKRKKNLNVQSFWTDMDPSSGVPLSLLQRLSWKMKGITAESGLSYRLDLRENGEENWRHTSEHRLQLRRLSACQCSPLALLLLILQNYGEN